MTSTHELNEQALLSFEEILRALVTITAPAEWLFQSFVRDRSQTVTADLWNLSITDALTTKEQNAWRCCGAIVAQ
ncbi:MAG: hypothetical protein AAF511_03010 [Pseudomonadota bacterium]